VKLLLDQNISYRLVDKINLIFPGTEQVKRLGLENKTDREIWNFAKKEDFTIVTFDSDFNDMSLLLGHPPKVIWIKAGNLTTKSLERLIKEKSEQIELFISDTEISCLEIMD
jgi:predicted nuclease of predicted toxin-antitoxin system